VFTSSATVANAIAVEPQLSQLIPVLAGLKHSKESRIPKPRIDIN